MTLPNNIILVSLARSGTHLVKTALANYADSPAPMISELDLDDINFHCNSSNGKFNLYVTHYDFLEKWERGKIDRLNSIVENRNIHVIFLDRKDINELILSRAIAQQLGWEASSGKFKKKIRLKKSDLEESYKNTVRLKLHNNLDTIPLKVHEKIYYEDIVTNGLIINGKDIPLNLIVAEDFKYSVIMNPPKDQIISNYKTVVKWLDEFSKIYNESWAPYFKMEIK